MQVIPATDDTSCKIHFSKLHIMQSVCYHRRLLLFFPCRNHDMDTLSIFVALCKENPPWSRCPPTKAGNAELWWPEQAVKSIVDLSLIETSWRSRNIIVMLIHCVLSKCYSSLRDGYFCLHLRYKNICWVPRGMHWSAVNGTSRHCWCTLRAEIYVGWYNVIRCMEYRTVDTVARKKHTPKYTYLRIFPIMRKVFPCHGTFLPFSTSDKHRLVILRGSNTERGQ